MKVLVTGGCGYIGIKLVLKLIERGHQVRVLDQDAHEEISAHCDFLQGDIRDTGLLRQVLEGIDAVIHLAAVVPPSQLEPQIEEINFAATCTLGQLSKEKQVSRFILASTCALYGSGFNFDEDTPLSTTSLYASSKARAENCILALKGDGFHPTVLRLATVFGPSYRMGWQSLFNTLIRDAILDGSISIHDPNALRPFIHIDDVVQAIILVLEAPLEPVSGEIFNVGGINCTKAELARLIQEQFPRIEVELGNDPGEGYSVSFEKISRLGFKLGVTLDEGVVQLGKTLSQEPYKS